MTRTPAAVAPSSGDATRENPLRLPPGGTFTLELEPPTGPYAAREAWELRSDDERYRRRLTRADAFLDPTTQTFRLVFEGLFEDAEYTLLLHGEGEAHVMLFAGVAHADLVDRGEETEAPPTDDRDDESDTVEDEDPVETESDDAEVQHEPELDELELEPELEEEDDDGDTDDELHDIVAAFGDDPEEPPTGGLGSDDPDHDDHDDHDDDVDDGPGGHGPPPPPPGPGGRP